MGSVLEIDSHAASWSVEMPKNCASINRMSVFNEPAGLETLLGEIDRIEKQPLEQFM